jgi:allantoicase
MDNGIARFGTGVATINSIPHDRRHVLDMWRCPNGARQNRQVSDTSTAERDLVLPEEGSDEGEGSQIEFGHPWGLCLSRIPFVQFLSA